MDSIWRRTAELPQFAPLEGDLKTDVLIVGGGLAGLLCAYWLDRAGADYALVEADRLCGGVTGNTTAKLTFQHGLIYSRLLREFGPEKARLHQGAVRPRLGQQVRAQQPRHAAANHQHVRFQIPLQGGELEHLRCLPPDGIHGITSALA